MNDDDIKKLGQELAQGIKTQADCEQVLGKLLTSFRRSPKEHSFLLFFQFADNAQNFCHRFNQLCWDVFIRVGVAHQVAC